MLEKIKSWGDKPLSMKIMYVFVCIIVGFYLIESLICKIYDTDMYFLIATGREILENGIPHTNVWSIDMQSGFIVQQWLYTVLMAISDKFGYIGFTSLVAIQFVFLIWLLNHFFNIKHVSKGIKFVCIAIVIFYSQLYLFSTRPELITMILLLIECIALEHYNQSNKWQWLILLPITMLAEMNLHASMWPIHYAILLAYLVPSFYLPGVKDESIYKKWKHICVFVLIMTGVMFINPYGIDSILYIIKSFKADTFSYVSIQEISQPTFLSACGLTILLGLSLVFINHRLKALTSTSLNITLGFAALAVTALRHNMFSIFIMAFLLRDLAVILSDKIVVDIKKDVKNNILPIMIIGVLFFGLSCVGSISSVFSEEQVSGLDDIYEYINKDYDENTRIFTGFNNGAYFEWRGFKNIYMDARPELYTVEFTGDKNILSDYSRYCIYGFSTVDTNRDTVLVTVNEMNEWFYSYDFDYVVVTPYAEQNLYNYMLYNTDYKVVESCESDVYVLYEKIDK